MLIIIIIILFIYFCAYCCSSERKLWLTSLFLGTAALYSTRTVMPLCIVSLSKEMNWDKMQSVCNSFDKEFDRGN